MISNRNGAEFHYLNLGLPFSKSAGAPLNTPTPRSIRLFPSGGSILVTDSVFMNNPHGVCRLLRWFRKNILITKPASTWKIFTRPRLLEWLENLSLDTGTFSGGKIKQFQRLYMEYQKVMRPEDMDDGDDNTPKPTAPLQSAPVLPGYDLEGGLGKKRFHALTQVTNDNLLVKWFSDLTLQHLHKTRKFTILYDGPPERTKVWKEESTHVSLRSSRSFPSLPLLTPLLVPYLVFRRLCPERSSALGEH